MDPHHGPFRLHRPGPPPPPRTSKQKLWDATKNAAGAAVQEPVIAVAKGIGKFRTLKPTGRNIAMVSIAAAAFVAADVLLLYYLVSGFSSPEQKPYTPSPQAITSISLAGTPFANYSLDNTAIISLSKGPTDPGIEKTIVVGSNQSASITVYFNVNGPIPPSRHDRFGIYLNSGNGWPQISQLPTGYPFSYPSLIRNEWTMAANFVIHYRILVATAGLQTSGANASPNVVPIEFAVVDSSTGQVAIANGVKLQLRL